MGKREWGMVMISGLFLLTLGVVPFPIPHSPFPVQDTAKGKAVYVKWCSGCHGDGGGGDGPAAATMLPRPRNFTGAIYKIRSTASGQLPTDADLLRAIDEGLPGTAMPAWKTRLSDGERRDVVAYLKTFSAFFADTSQHVTPLEFGSAPGGGSGGGGGGRRGRGGGGCPALHRPPRPPPPRGGGPPPPPPPGRDRPLRR